jgi:hypothetical protein
MRRGPAGVGEEMGRSAVAGGAPTQGVAGGAPTQGVTDQATAERDRARSGQECRER